MLDHGVPGEEDDAPIDGPPEEPKETGLATDAAPGPIAQVQVPDGLVAGDSLLVRGYE